MDRGCCDVICSTPSTIQSYGINKTRQESLGVSGLSIDMAAILSVLVTSRTEAKFGRGNSLIKILNL